MRINKPWLVAELVLNPKLEGATKATISNFVDALFETLSDKMAAGDCVAIPDFGKFEVVESERHGKQPKFRAYKQLKLKAKSAA